MKKAFTLVELLIATALLGIILAATSTIFSVAIKNYRTESRKSEIQKEINFVADAISNELKNASRIDTVYQNYNLSENTIIFSTPAVDADENFIYGPQGQQKDIFIYTLGGNALRKIVVTDGLSNRDEKDSVVLNNLNLVNFTYLPNNLETTQVKFRLEVTTLAGKNTIKKSAERLVNLRNR